MGWTEQANSNMRRELGGSERGEAVVASQNSNSTPSHGVEINAYELRKRVDQARKAAAGGDVGAQQQVEQVIIMRQEFWIDTCRDVVGRRTGYKQVFELYQKYGCRFCEATHGEVQGILDALDSALPFWDRDHPELFYQTLELNFGELVRHP